MSEILISIIGFASLMVGSVLGYYARQSIAKRKAGTLEAEIQKKIKEVRDRSQLIISEAKEQASEILEKARVQVEQRQEDLLKTERFLRKKETSLEERDVFLDKKEQELKRKIQRLREMKELIDELKKKAEKKLEEIAGISKAKAKKELLETVEKECQKEIFERIKRMEKEGQERFERQAKEILASVIQRCAVSQAQEVTTTIVSLPNEEIKGRIIGKEGRNIKTLEKLTGTEIVIDETPEIVVISGFNPIRRQIAKTALERLIKDRRIQPARIEQEVKKAEQEIASQIKEAGEQAIFETGVLGLDSKLVELLGRLNFRTSYGQNVLLHSIEVSHLAGALASELGANVQVCKKAGLLHDIGKSLDHQVEGSHVDIGIKILEKFGVEKEVIDAMKSHHGDCEPESLEAVLVQVADQISGARPGARKENLEEYLKRLEDLEKIALSFPGVEKAYAIQAGRELRVFANPEEIDDLEAYKLAKEIASKIQEELRYPGEIKVTLIRERRVVEYAK